MRSLRLSPPLLVELEDGGSLDPSVLGGQLVGHLGGCLLEKVLQTLSDLCLGEKYKLVVLNH